MTHSQPMTKPNWTEVMKFLKDYGFVIENAKLYGGLKSNYDYGPLGVKIKTEIKELWQKHFVNTETFIYNLDSAIFTQSSVLEASGHISKFKDWILTCSHCKTEVKLDETTTPNKTTEASIQSTNEFKNKCLHCKKISVWKVQKRNLLFQTKQGSSENSGQTIFLRPETAQGSFTNLNKVIHSLKLQLPLGISQIGKVFRNELTTQYGNFRTCEFEQMEIQFFFANKEEKIMWWNYWTNKIKFFLENVLQINPQMIRTREHNLAELAHYATKTIDFEYQFPFGWKEIWGLSDRDQYDLKTHQRNSQTDLTILDHNQNKILPFVVEPSTGVERLMLTLIVDKLRKKDNKITLAIPWQFCYYQIAVLPLTEKLLTSCERIFDMLKSFLSVRLDHKGTIGKRYLFHDAIGTYLCLTFDFTSLTDQAVTIRFRDSKIQKRIPLNQLQIYLKKLFQDG